MDKGKSVEGQLLVIYSEVVNLLEGFVVNIIFFYFSKARCCQSIYYSDNAKNVGHWW